MANMADCIQRGVAAGEIDPVRAADAQASFDQLVARYETMMPRHQAEAAAAADLKTATTTKKKQRYHMVVNQLQAMRRIKGLIEAAPDPAIAIRNLIEFSGGSGFTGESVRSLTQALQSSINAELNEVLAKTGLNMLGATRDRALLENIVKELFGERTGDDAALQLATAVDKQQNRMRQMANAHGMNIGLLKNYGITQSHNAQRIRLAKFDKWRDIIEPRLAWHDIPDFTTGRPFAAAPGEIPPRSVTDQFLREAFKNITTGGNANLVPSMAVGGKALYNQRADHRVLHFSSGTAFLEYNAEFGNTDPFSAMIGGLHGLASDVAQMRVLGPSPKQGLEFAIQVAKVRAVDLDEPKLLDRVEQQGKMARTMLATHDGSNSVAEREGWATFFRGVRAFNVSTQLGSAILSSATDLVTLRVAAKAVGMNPTNVLSRSVNLMASSATRATAARMGFVADSLADAGAGHSRYYGELLGEGLMQRLSGITIRASGLSFWTDMHRIAFQMEFAGHLAENASRPFADIDPDLRRALAARDITPADWDAMRNPELRFHPKRGGGNGGPALDDPDFISPHYWLANQTSMPRAEAEGLAMRWQMIVEEQLQLAVPTTSLEARAIMIGDTKPGTWTGEIARSIGSYKGYALTNMLAQIRHFNSRPTWQSKAGLFITILGGMTLMGALAVQLKELAKGNDPRPMAGEKGMAFWMAAIAQGGGLGIFGDFFFSETSRTGQGLAGTIAGPTVGFVGDVFGLVAGNVGDAVAGNDLNLGRDATNFLRRNTPVLSSLWWARTAWDRMVADPVQEMLDPGAEAAWKRSQRARDKAQGNTTWWSHGQMTPDRAPDFSNITGANP
jgi:hypothetical protein